MMAVPVSRELQSVEARAAPRATKAAARVEVWMTYQLSLQEEATGNADFAAHGLDFDIHRTHLI